MTSSLTSFLKILLILLQKMMCISFPRIRQVPHTGQAHLEARPCTTHGHNALGFLQCAAKSGYYEKAIMLDKK